MILFYKSIINSQYNSKYIYIFMLVIFGTSMCIWTKTCYCLQEPSIIIKHSTSTPSNAGERYDTIHFSDDETLLLATSVMGVDIWNIDSQELMQSFSPQDFNVNNFISLRTTNNLSRFLFVHSGDYNPIHAIMVDSSNGNALWQIESEPSDYFTSHLYLASGGYTYRTGKNILSQDGGIAIVYFQWDKDERKYFLVNGQTGEFQRTLNINASPAEIFPDNQRLLAAEGGQDPFICIYNLKNDQLIHKFPNSMNAKLSNDTSSLYVSNPDSSTIRVYNTQTGIIEKQFSSLNNLGQDYYLTPHGDRILYSEGLLTIGRLDYDAEKEIGVLTKLQTFVESTLDIDSTSYRYGYVKGFSKNGKYAYLVIRETNTIWLWDLEELGLSGVKQGEEYR